MEKYISIFLLVGILVACQEQAAPSVPVVEKDNREQSRDTTIQTSEYLDSIKGIEFLLTALQKDQFNIKKLDVTSGLTYENCKERSSIEIGGKGVRAYSFKRKIPYEGKPTFYPQFTVYVYHFNSLDLAGSTYKRIERNRKSGSSRTCNRKSIDTLIIKGTEIYHFITTAEMFRSTIEEYAILLESHNISPD